MKKSKIAIAVGAFIGLTLLLASNQCDNKLYEKQKNFSSSSEILEELNDNILRDYNEISDGVVIRNCTPELLECFSERARLTNIDLHAEKIEIKEIINLTEEQKKLIIDDYENLREAYSKAKPISKVEAVRVKYQPYYTSYYDEEKALEPDDRLEYMNLVFVDEGEGMVIDYIRVSKEQDSIEG